MVNSINKIQLFRGEELLKVFNLHPPCTIIFSDYTRETLSSTEFDGIRFTKDMMFMCSNDVPYGKVFERDTWFVQDHIEICPWENIIGIESAQTGKNSVHKAQMVAWLDSLPDRSSGFPFMYVRKGCLILMIEGRPYSVRSQKGKNKVRRIVEGSIDKIKEIIPSPVAFPVVMRIYVFTTEDTILPDVDRFSTPIMDTFNGIVYRDDNQISELHPRVINIKPALEVLECKTHPMALLELDRLPVGVLYPLSKTVQEYFVVDVRYSPLYLL